MKIVGINSSLSGSKTEKAMNSIKFSENVDFSLINMKDLEMSFADGRDYREYENDNKMLVQSLIDADGIIAGFGIKRGRWYKPMVADVEYKIKVEITEKTVRKEGRNGLVAFTMTVTDPDGDICLEYTPLGLVRFKNSK